MAKIKAQVYYAEPALCTDNGAMIAFAGYQRLKAGQHDGLAVTTTPRWPMTELTIPE
ncbi:tRNA N6-adenosine threonylcarbamoyltransferase [Acinetobacter baumannii]|nr:tRNA N6-adenosine threonylcarbamoyltransferase [Acinetobacter baumannii]CVH81449.1 tRNA N6-adenosine threonylcarbamoyltransferase [Acinetobacter baumannii]